MKLSELMAVLAQFPPGDDVDVDALIAQHYSGPGIGGCGKDCKTPAACAVYAECLGGVEVVPVLCVHRNEAGQIVLRTPAGEPFDMSQHIGATFYAVTSAAPSVAKDETGWLIEVHKGTKYTCWLTSQGGYTKDANEAFRFGRKQDAEEFLEIFFNAKYGDWIVALYKRRLGKDLYSVTEHMWPAAMSAAPSVAKDGAA